MTSITTDHAVFSVDFDATSAYYTTHAVCGCAYCRNLYAQIQDRYPQLDAFLSEFGVDIRRPDEAASLENPDSVDYLFVGYTVAGTMEAEGRYETEIGPLHVTVSRGDNPRYWFPNEQTGPCFFISVSGISLPWVLPETFPG